MAYDAEAAFASSTAIFNVEKMVAEILGFYAETLEAKGFLTSTEL